MPSIWPETYAYPLTLALRTGLPVAAFDLGALGERLRTGPNSHLLSSALAIDPTTVNDRLLALDISADSHCAGLIPATAYDDLLRDYYDLAIYTPPDRESPVNAL